MSYSFADRLIEMRKSKGLSQEELAKRLGVSRQAISKWERAESTPDIANLLALADLYETSLDNLVRGAEEVPSEEAVVITKEASEATPAVDAVDATSSVAAANSFGSFPPPPDGAQPIRPPASASFTTPTTSASNAAAPMPGSIPVAGSAPTQTTAAFAQTTGASYQAPAQDPGSASAYAATSAPAPVPAPAPAPAEQPATKLEKNPLLTFPYPLFVVLAYLILGFCFNLWHPGWIIFFTIPFYYWIIRVIKHDPEYIARHTVPRQ